MAWSIKDECVSLRARAAVKIPTKSGGTTAQPILIDGKIVLLNVPT